MKKVLLCAVLLANAATAQTISPVDGDTTERFRLAAMAEDPAAAIEPLLSDNVRISVSQQMGPNGPNRQVADSKGKAEARKQFAAVFAATGKPTDASCAPADGVSVFCKYTFGLPGRDVQSMIMFDSKKIGGLMIKYGGAALQ